MGWRLDARWDPFDSEILLRLHLCTVHSYTLPLLLLRAGRRVRLLWFWFLVLQDKERLFWLLVTWDVCCSWTCSNPDISIIIYTRRSTNCCCLFLPPPHSSSCGSYLEIRKRDCWVWPHEAGVGACTLLCYPCGLSYSLELGVIALLPQNGWLHALWGGPA